MQQDVLTPRNVVIAGIVLLVLIAGGLVWRATRTGPGAGAAGAGPPNLSQTMRQEMEAAYGNRGRRSGGPVSPGGPGGPGGPGAPAPPGPPGP